MISWVRPKMRKSKSREHYWKNMLKKCLKKGCGKHGNFMKKGAKKEVKIMKKPIKKRCEKRSKNDSPDQCQRRLARRTLLPNQGVPEDILQTDKLNKHPQLAR